MIERVAPEVASQSPGAGEGDQPVIAASQHHFVGRCRSKAHLPGTRQKSKPGSPVPSAPAVRVPFTAKIRIVENFDRSVSSQRWLLHSPSPVHAGGCPFDEESACRCRDSTAEACDGIRSVTAHGEGARAELGDRTDGSLRFKLGIARKCQECARNLR